MADIDALKDYERFRFTDGPHTREVFRRGTGPAVIIMHEIPGLHPLVVAYADRAAAAGMTVFLPSLFGSPGKPVSNGYALGQMFLNICIRREFNAWANGKSSDIVVLHELNELTVVCLPKDLPEFIEIDLAELPVGDTIHLSDLKLP